MKVIARNTFHNTEAALIVRNRVISPATARKLRNKMCAEGCACFADHTQYFEKIQNKRAPLNTELKLYPAQQSDGSILLEA